MGNNTLLRMVVRTSRSRTQPEDQLPVDISQPDIYDIVEYDWQARFDPLLGEVDDPAGGVFEPSIPKDEHHNLAPGLVRRVTSWPRQTTSTSPAGNDLSSAEPVRPLPPADHDQQTDPVPEVVRLRFRYSTTGAWQDHWDSRVSGRLPDAIEMSFDLDLSPPPSSANRIASPAADDVRQRHSLANSRDVFTLEEESEHEYRFVIAVNPANVVQQDLSSP